MVLRKRPAAQEPRLYRHITYRSQGKKGKWGAGAQAGWIVQYDGRTWGGFHETQHDAAKTLQQAMGLSCLSELPRLPGAPPAPAVSRFTGVYWHKNKNRWTARSASCSFASVGAAARATDAPRKRPKPSTIVQRLKFIRRVFDAGELPADLEDLFSRAKPFERMCRQEPVLEPIGIQLKYGPWRAKLIECWQASRVQRPAPLSVKQRTQSIFQVLVKVAKAVSKEGVPFWSQHAGRGVSRHSGGQMVLKSLGVLIRHESKGLSFQGAADESDDEERELSSAQWKIASSKQERDDAIDKLQRLIQAWDELSGTFKDAPTKCTEWSSKMTEATQLLHAMPGRVPRLPSSLSGDVKAKYTSAWTFRGVMLLRMQQAGFKKLNVDNIALATFCRMNPDENENMLRVRDANRSTIHTTRELLQHCGVQRPELLSMEMCLAGDQGLDKVDVEKEDVRQWKRAKHDLMKRHRMTPHIACIAKAVRQPGEAEG